MMFAEDALGNTEQCTMRLSESRQTNNSFGYVSLPQQDDFLP
jgi:hypothetical protein